MADPDVSGWRSTRRRPLSSFSSRVIFGVVLPLALHFNSGVHAFGYRNSPKPFLNNLCRTKKRLPFTRGIASSQDQNTPNNFDIPNGSGTGDANVLYSLRNPSFSRERQVEWEEVLGTDHPPLETPGRLWKQYSVAAASTCLATIMCWLLIAASGVGAWRYYLAGGLCAAVSHTVPGT